MPRAGLDPHTVAATAADVADELGLAALSMNIVAERLGVKPPSLYKHVDGLADLRHRVAVLGATELGDALRDSLQGITGYDALRAAAQTVRAFAQAHPGRYAATTEVRPAGDDALSAALQRALGSFEVVLAAYPLDPADRVHALRMLRSLVHGFVDLDGAGGFRLATDVDASFDWMLRFLDRGLRESPSQ